MLKFRRRPTQHCMALSWDWIDNSPTHNLIAKGRGERRVLDGSGKRRVKQLFMMLKKRCQTESYHEWGASHEDCFPQIITQGCYEPFKIMSLCGISYLTSNSSSLPAWPFFLYAKTPFLPPLICFLVLSNWRRIIRSLWGQGLWLGFAQMDCFVYFLEAFIHMEVLTFVWELIAKTPCSHFECLVFTVLVRCFNLF